MSDGASFTGTRCHAEILTACTNEPAEFELALRPWELLCQPRCGGDFRHSISAIRTEHFVLYREHYSLPLTLQGLTPAGMLVFGVPVDARSEPTYWGRQCSSSSLAATWPGPLDATVGAGHSQLVAMVAIDFLSDAMPGDDVERLEKAAVEHRFPASRDLVTEFSNWGNRILDATASHPALFEDLPIVHSIGQELLAFLLRVSAELGPDPVVPARSTRQRGLALALEYLRDRLDGRVSVAELCRVTGVSERTLQYAFRDEFGISPNAFMRQRRLHAVRRVLMTSSPQESSVSRVALQHGFLELGRFAGDYRRLFGVHPSDTLRSRG